TRYFVRAVVGHCRTPRRRRCTAAPHCAHVNVDTNHLSVLKELAVVNKALRLLRTASPVVTSGLHRESRPSSQIPQPYCWMYGSTSDPCGVLQRRALNLLQRVR